MKNTPMKPKGLKANMATPFGTKFAGPKPELPKRKYGRMVNPNVKDSRSGGSYR